MTIDEGAVAAASAARTMAYATGSPRAARHRANTSPPQAVVSTRTMTRTRRPVFFSFSARKNSPAPKAMRARAISARKSVRWMIWPGIRARQSGPIRMPMRIYAVTFGSRTSFVSRVMAKPPKSISASDSTTPGAWGIACRVSENASSICPPPLRSGTGSRQTCLVCNTLALLHIYHKRAAIAIPGNECIFIQNILSGELTSPVTCDKIYGILRTNTKGEAKK